MEKKKLKLLHGIPGHNLDQIEREVNADEPPAWPVNDDLKVVGKRVKRTDAEAKVTGRAVYTSDVQLPGLLIGRMLRSPHPHAKIKSIDTSAAENYPGVYAVHVFKNVIGMAQPQSDADQGIYPDVKFAGQPVAGVAAESWNIAEEALRLIKVEYQTKPFVIDLEEAQKPEAPLVFTANVEQEDQGGGGGGAKGLKLVGNVRGPSIKSFYGGPRGDLKEGFDKADLIIEHTYRTQVQTHCSLETHGVVVDWKPNEVTVYASTQNTKNVRDEFAEVFDLPKSRVRVIQEFMGGGFGAKHALGNFGVMAGELSKKSGRPVKVMLDRKEEHITSGNRPNSIHYLKVGATKDGKLTAIQQRSHGTAGVGLGAGVGRVAQIMYECPNFATEQYDVFTHAGPGAAWRAPGNVQGAFALEQLIDEMAEKLEIDPVAYRDIIDSSDVRKVERQRGAEKFGWKYRKPNADAGPVKKGYGVAQSHWPRITGINSTAEVRAFKDGAIEVRSAVQDIGTGTKTIMAQVVAEELGLQPEDITVRIGDTLFPDGPPSGGSQVTGSITPPTRNAAYKLKLQIFDQVAEKLETEPENLYVSDGEIISQKDKSKRLAFKDALKEMRTGQILTSASRSDDYGGFLAGNAISYGGLGSVQFAEVTVDTETGFIKVDRVVAAHSCGRPINITQLESQINGGVIQGVSYALYEYRVMDKYTGHQMNANLDQYKTPYAFEIPEIEVVLVEEYSAQSSTDAAGIGEPSNIATAAAVANAIYNATGVRFYESPITPSRVLNALNNI